MGFSFFRKKTPGTGLVVPTTEMREQWDSCMPGFEVTGEPLQARPWSPMNFNVKILVAGDLDEIQSMSGKVMDVQRQMQESFKKDFPGTNLMFSVGTFLDGCRHDTPWASNPTDIGGTTTRWHCYQSDTQFTAALNALKDEGQDADVVIMVGERFNDDLEKTIQAARDLLASRGTKTFALSGRESRLSLEYKKIAEAGGGLCLPRLKDNGVEFDATMLVREITHNVMFKKSGRDMAALPVPQTEEEVKIRGLLGNIGKPSP